jgi:hypothetical protein
MGVNVTLAGFAGPFQVQGIEGGETFSPAPSSHRRGGPSGFLVVDGRVTAFSEYRFSELGDS